MARQEALRAESMPPAATAARRCRQSSGVPARRRPTVRAALFRPDLRPDLSGHQCRYCARKRRAAESYGREDYRRQNHMAHDILSSERLPPHVRLSMDRSTALQLARLDRCEADTRQARAAAQGTARLRSSALPLTEPLQRSIRRWQM